MILSILIALQLLDGLTTWLVLKRGGYEANPVLVKLSEFLRRFTGAKWAWLVVAKLFGVAASWWLVFNAPAWFCYVLALIYASVVVNNIRAYRLMSK